MHAQNQRSFISQHSCQLYSNTAVLCFGLRRHRIGTVLSAGTVVASIISTDVLILGVSSQHFPSSANLCMFLKSQQIDVTFEGLIGNYAVLSQI